MALTSIIRRECKSCGKIAVEASRLTIGKSKIIKLACGHLLSEADFSSNDESRYESLVFSDGCKPWPYQIDAIKFVEASGFRCLIADEQGVGKTIESLCTVKLHRDKLLPLVVVCPTKVKIQWMREIIRICGAGEDFLTQVITSKKEKALPGFQIYIVTYDMLKSETMFDMVDDIQCLIIDECQRIKNHLSERAKAVQRIAEKTKYIIPMSGTPIKNHAGEFFTVLNLIAPTRFPHFQSFLRDYCDSYETMYGYKVGGINDIDKFSEATSDIIIRRKKEDVLKDLPALQRKFFHVELDRKLNKAYAAALDDLDDLLYGDNDLSGFESGGAVIAIMSRLRHITGISKIDDCVDWTTEFLLSCDRPLVIFTHHLDVMEILKNKLNSYLADGGFPLCEVLSAQLNANESSRMVDRFKNGSSRIMIASTLAAGEGLNLQFCSDAVMLERQWNPANEEQAEARFHRFGQKNSVSVTYMIASGTIDEYFSELVEQKRAIVAGALDKKEVDWNQSDLMKELAQVLTTKGREKWRL